MNESKSPKRIFVDDPLVHYATTTVSIERTKMQIDGILAEYGVKDVMWHWDPPRQIYVMFKIEEEIEQRPIAVGVRVDCPSLWNRKKEARGRRAKRRKVGTCDFDCPQCNRHHHRVLWEQSWDFCFDTETKKWTIQWGCGPVTAVVECVCGKVWLVGETDYDGSTELFDLTPEKKVASEPHFLTVAEAREKLKVASEK